MAIVTGPFLIIFYLSLIITHIFPTDSPSTALDPFLFLTLISGLRKLLASQKMLIRIIPFKKNKQSNELRLFVHLLAYHCRLVASIRRSTASGCSLEQSLLLE